MRLYDMFFFKKVYEDLSFVAALALAMLLIVLLFGGPLAVAFAASGMMLAVGTASYILGMTITYAFLNLTRTQ
jgi:hypothetical protein